MNHSRFRSVMDTLFLVVAAAEGDRPRRGELHFDSASEPKQFYVIEDSNHVFTKGASAEALYDITLTWMRKWMPAM